MKQTPLLCELHAHTTWSDGELTMRELCDLYGRAGFDVLAVTDHALPAGGVQPDRFTAYLAALEAENERALRMYDMLVLPGLELTFDDPDPCVAGHALAVGLRSYVDLGAGLEHALRAARAHGAALVAAHPYPPG
jgi:predicted metal-dependent phosphoesterase TrpH